MAPKNTKVTSSSTRASRIKSGRATVTQGAARNRAQRATLGSPAPRRPLASGNVTGPLQGGTRTSSRQATPAASQASNVRRQGRVTPPNAAGVRRQGRVVPRTQANLQRGQISPTKAKPTPQGASVRPKDQRMQRLWNRADLKDRSQRMNANRAAIKAQPAANRQLAKDTARLTRRAQVMGTRSLRTARGQAVTNALRNVRGGGAPSGAARLLRDVAMFSRGITPASVAAAVLAPRPTSTKDTLTSQGIVGPKRVGPKIVGPKKVGPKLSAAKQFDKAFTSARKAGKSTFTWRGKKYTTQVK